MLFGAAVIPPILDLLNAAFGFAGAPGAGATALAAPQAALISSLAKGVLGGNLDWSLLGLGAAIGAVVIMIDEVLARTTRFRFAPLAVGSGIYLPMGLTLLIPLGAIIGAVYDRRCVRAPDPEAARRLGVLLATGLIVGESLFQVVFAGVVAGTGSDAPLALVAADFSLAIPLGLAIFAGLIAVLYLRTWRLARLPITSGVAR